jgi:hypothetical protein
MKHSVFLPVTMSPPILVKGERGRFNFFDEEMSSAEAVNTLLNYSCTSHFFFFSTNPGFILHSFPNEQIKQIAWPYQEIRKEMVKNFEQKLLFIVIYYK